MFYQPGLNGLDLDVRKRDMPSVVTRLSASVSNCGEGVEGVEGVEGIRGIRGIRKMRG